MKLFVLENDYGVALREAKSLEEARANGIREQGTAHFKGVREATDLDIAHIYSMGGWVPPSHRKGLCR